MRYTVHLFALDGVAFARELAEESASILERTRLRLETEGRIKGKALTRGLGLAAEIARGEIPARCSGAHFWALIWLADTELERIPLNPLVGFNRIGHLEEVGLWPLLGGWSPPFPAPRGRDLCPAVGYLPHDQIASHAIPTLNDLPAADDHARYVRQLVIEVLETLDEDGLDLLAVVVE